MTATLRRLLDDNERFDFAGRGTVNHLPMALYALSRMRASDDRLINYFRWWEENRALPRRDSACRVDRRDWPQYVGQATSFDALSAMFRDWIAEHGNEEVIAAVFPALSEGVGAAAFHGLIRLAYGIEADHAGEIAAGLAGLCTRYDDLGLPACLPAPCPDAGSAFAALAEALSGASFTGQGIIGRMRAAASDRRFAAAFCRPPISPALLTDLARISIALYWQTGDFTVLHMVTASHAARVVFDHFPRLASEKALAALWGAACAAYASVGAPRLAEPPAASETPPWKEIFAGAVAKDDDHVIKMTYTCHCEAKRYSNPLYQAAAARLVAVGKA